ncbi:MAG: MoaD/ThiS family protein [Candidatus Dormibacteria bacterium]
MIRVVLPAALRSLTQAPPELGIDVPGESTMTSLLDALEATYPALRGTIRDQVTQRRRPFIRFYAGEEDLSHQSPGDPLPDGVTTGAEALVIVGAMSGG